MQQGTDFMLGRQDYFFYAVGVTAKTANSALVNTSYVAAQNNNELKRYQSYSRRLVSVTDYATLFNSRALEQV